MQHLRQTRTGHNRVLDHRIRRDAANRAERALARRPKFLAFRFIAREPAIARAVLHANARHFTCFVIESGFDAIELDQQSCAGVGRQSGCKHTRLDRANDLTVHHLQRGRHHARGDDRGNRMTRIVNLAKLREQRAHRGRNLTQFQRRFSRDAECSFRTNIRTKKIISVRFTAEIDDLAACQHDATADDVICGSAVLQTMNAAGALGDVAADRTARLARRIGHVIQIVRQRRARDVKIHHARLHNSQTILDIDAQYLAHARKLDDDARVERERTARETRSRSTRREGDLCARELAHDRRGLFS